MPIFFFFASSSGGGNVPLTRGDVLSISSLPLCSIAAMRIRMYSRTSNTVRRLATIAGVSPSTPFISTSSISLSVPYNHSRGPVSIRPKLSTFATGFFLPTLLANAVLNDRMLSIQKSENRWPSSSTVVSGFSMSDDVLLINRKRLSNQCSNDHSF